MKDWLKRRSFVFVQRGTDSAIGFGRRVLVHIVSLVAAFSIAMTPHPIYDRVGLLFACYLGLICLFPGGNPRRADWLVPVACGVFVGIVHTVCGFPLPIGILSAGVQTYVLRVLCKKTRMGWEWSVAPFLIVTCIHISSSLPMTLSVYIGLGAFGVAAAFGLLAFGFLTRYVLTPRRRRDLAEASAFLKDALMLDFLPQPFFGPLNRLADQAKIMSESVPLLDDSMLTPIMGIRLVRKRVAILQSGTTPPRWDFESERFLDAVIVLTEDIEGLLSRTELLPHSLPPDDDASEETKRLRFHADNALNLTRKKKDLPKRLHKRVDGLRLATQSILDAMRNDPRDMEKGDKFLTRYLPAAHKVLDDYIRLSATSKDNTEIKVVLDRCEDFLGKLEEAFKKEHVHLLRNDTIDLQAEMATIETLMKLDGK